MSPPLAPGFSQPPQEQARNAFNRIATAAWLAYHRGQLSREEYQRGLLAAQTTYQLVLAHPELTPPPPVQAHGDALQDELVEQAVRMLHQDPGPAAAAARGRPGGQAANVDAAQHRQRHIPHAENPRV